jgi:hypothetical protein
MTAVTSRYTGSSETRMEADLARLRPLGAADEFVAELDRICASELTNDFWTIRLPNDLERRSARTPALFSYYAALCVLKARVLFSKQMVSDLLDPAVKEVKQAIERHHLFPEGVPRVDRNRIPHRHQPDSQLRPGRVGRQHKDLRHAPG